MRCFLTHTRNLLCRQLVSHEISHVIQAYTLAHRSKNEISAETGSKYLPAEENTEENTHPLDRLRVWTKLLTKTLK